MRGLTGLNNLNTVSKYTEISFQYYPARVNSNEPLGIISLEQFLISTKTPKDSTKAIFDQIAAAELSSNKKLKAELKQNHLFYFTPCVHVHPFRRYACIKHFTGLLILDFDHIDNARDFKYFLFDEYKSLIAAWLSPSKRGLKCLVKIPKVNTVEEFKEYYFGIASEMEVYNGFDPSGQNAVLPLFQLGTWNYYHGMMPTPGQPKGFTRMPLHLFRCRSLQKLSISARINRSLKK